MGQFCENFVFVRKRKQGNCFGEYTIEKEIH